MCVHNALQDVMQCLQAIIDKTDGQYTLYIVNDGSATDTSEYLRNFKKSHSHAVLLENKTAQGYTKAANRGLKASTGDYVVLLNSDTIVTPEWADKLIECGESSQKIGIIGPLSNAASWQSVPERFDNKGDWMVNRLPSSWTVDDMACMISKISAKQFPRVPLINGFCFAIKRSAINAIGYLDEEAFPRGYGEENDYCIRAINAGVELAIADHLYIYHAKSRSFGHQARQEFSKQGSNALRKKHGSKRIKQLVAEIQNNPVLEKIRQRIVEHLKNAAGPNEGPAGYSTTILFLLPVRGGGGGTHSVVQEAMGMVRLGVKAQIAIKHQNTPDFQRNYPKLWAQHPELFFSYHTVDELVAHAASFDVAIATVFHSLELLHKIVQATPEVMPAYYVQDYEPWFFEEGSDEWNQAYQSYTLIPNTMLFAKTAWLCEMVETRHRVRVEKVCPSIDHQVYFPALDRQRGPWPVHMVAMIRPSTPRRGPARTLWLLKRLQAEFGDRVVITTFGCDPTDPGFQDLERDFEFHHQGILVREAVAELLRHADIFIDLSDYQAFGRTGLEAMATGCVAVLPVEGGVHEYAVDHENALLVDVHSDSQCYTTVRTLVTDHALRTKLQRQALLKAAEYPIQKAALSEYLILESRRQEWLAQRRQALQISPAKATALRRQPIRVYGLLSLTSAGTPAGSAYIRMVLPLSHESVRQTLKFVYGPEEQLSRQTPDVVVVQRTAIPDSEAAYRLLDYCTCRGIRTVYETDDDLFDIHDSHRESDRYRAMIEGATFFAMNADLVTVSSELLKDKLKQLNTHIEVLPNALDERLWLPPLPCPWQRDQNPEIRLLYMGTRTHLNDLHIVEAAIRQLIADYGMRVSLDIIGVMPAEINLPWCNIVDIPTNARRDYSGFARWIQGHNRWHIGIAPLQDIEFNRCKSHIKYLDYAALGLATVCSDLPAYHSIIDQWVDGVLVDNTTEAWYNALKRLIEDAPLRAAIARNAHRKLVEQHLLKVQGANWARVYAQLMEKTQAIIPQDASTHCKVRAV